MPRTPGPVLKVSEVGRGSHEECVHKVLECLADTDAPSMTFPALSEVNAKIHMIILAQFKPNTTTAAWQEVLGPKRLIAAGSYLSQSSKPHYSEPLG